MFLRRRSVHGRLMGDIRSAQQKCVRRAFLEPLILLQLEHLLSTPDMSLAALKRLVVIAAEDIGLGAPDLIPVLNERMEGWKGLSQFERARRLIEVSYLAVARPASRWIPHWAVTLVTSVPTDQSWRAEEVMLNGIRASLRAGDWEQMGLDVEEGFLRTTLKGEVDLPQGIGFSIDFLSKVWDVMLQESSLARIPRMKAWRHCFGTPSKISISSRLFLYLAVMDSCLRLPVESLSRPVISDEEVASWLERAAHEVYDIPDWMMDKHTAQGRRANKGQQQFFEEGAVLARPSDVLGIEREEEMRLRAKDIYLERERLYGRECRTKHIRKRWREAVRTNELKKVI